MVETEMSWKGDLSVRADKKNSQTVSETIEGLQDKKPTDKGNQRMRSPQGVLLRMVHRNGLGGGTVTSLETVSGVPYLLEHREAYGSLPLGMKHPPIMVTLYLHPRIVQRGVQLSLRRLVARRTARIKTRRYQKGRIRQFPVHQIQSDSRHVEKLVLLSVTTKRPFR